jgi:hypothetical protein
MPSGETANRHLACYKGSYHTLKSGSQEILLVATGGQFMAAVHAVLLRLGRARDIWSN